MPSEMTSDRLTCWRFCVAPNRPHLYRLLRALASFGVVAESTPEHFLLTPFGKPLRKEAGDSEWAAVVFWADLLADSWSYLTQCVARVRQSRPAVAEDFDCRTIFISVKHVFQHVKVGSGRDFVAQVGRQQLTAIVQPLESRDCGIDGFPTID